MTTPEIPGTFWGQIDHQLNRIRAEKPDTFAALRVILTDPTYDQIVKESTRYGVRGEHVPLDDPRADPAAAFFAGSGGDATLAAALYKAGWSPVWVKESYWYAMSHPETSAVLTYIEGDVYEGDRR